MFQEIFEELNQDDHTKDALAWLKNKFGDRYKYKHRQNLSDIDKSFYASINDKEIIIKAKKFDTNGDGEPDVVVFKIEIPEEPEEPEEPEL